MSIIRLVNQRLYQSVNSLNVHRIADDPKTDIAQKMKSLSSETKLLRNMKKPVASEKTTSVTTNDTVENSSRTESVDHVSAPSSFNNISKTI